ncbi:MAG: PEP-CTERM sorting domain-containing protein [Leptolyngbya sp. DLM2.Bin27]|nr:MAG: PEP-CTERM sorting domain-containing protein [Leptolyngbya sp. DLM2.Bin27]
MKKTKILSAALVLTGLLGSLAPEALANPGRGKGGGGQPTTSLTCASGSVTSNPLSGGSSLSYTQCLNPVSGNDVSNTIAADLTAFLNSTLGDWVFDGKYEGGQNASGPNDFGFSWVQTGNGSGTWSLAQAVTTPFVISLKAGNAYTAYYFDGTASFDSGTWATFDQKDLSHASFFVGRGGLTPEAPNATVPEPASAAALALVGLSAIGLRRKQQA